MKRFIILIMIAAMLFALCACGKAVPADTQSEDGAVNTSAPDDNNITDNVESGSDTVDEGGSENTVDGGDEGEGGEEDEPVEGGFTIQTAVLLRN